MSIEAFLNSFLSNFHLWTIFSRTVFISVLESFWIAFLNITFLSYELIYYIKFHLNFMNYSICRLDLFTLSLSFEKTVVFWRKKKLFLFLIMLSPIFQKSAKVVSSTIYIALETLFLRLKLSWLSKEFVVLSRNLSKFSYGVRSKAKCWQKCLEIRTWI